MGLVTSLVGLVLAVAWERSRRDQQPDEQEQQDSGASALDEELAQTFPASDPLPRSHRVD